MLRRYLDLQTDQLEKLGAEKQAEQQRYELEERRYHSLQALHESMAHAGQHSSLFHQNRLTMRGLLGELRDNQEQELLVARLDFQHKQQALLAQFGKVKALEILGRKQARKRADKARRAEQHELDDWLSRPRRIR